MHNSHDQAFPGLVRFMGVEGFFLNGRFVPVNRGADDPPSGTAGSGTPPEGNKDGGATGGEKKPDGSGNDNTSGEKTFTQEEVNALVSREASRAQRGKLDPKELGFDSQKALTDFVTEMKAKKDNEKTEADKALEKAIEDRKKELEQEVVQKANRRVVKSDFKLAATQAGVSPTALEDAYVLAQADAGLWKGVTYNEETEQTEGLDEQFFKDLKEKKPFLFGSGDSGDKKPPSGDAGAGGNGGDKTAEDAQLTEHFPFLGQLASQAGGKVL